MKKYEKIKEISLSDAPFFLSSSSSPQSSLLTKRKEHDEEEKELNQGQPGFIFSRITIYVCIYEIYIKIVSKVRRISSSASQQQEDDQKRDEVNGEDLISRCDLAFHLSQTNNNNNNNNDIPGLSYLYSLPSSSQVDAELSSLCWGEVDEEGKELLSLMLTEFSCSLSSLTNLPSTQSYLHRFLILYEEVISSTPSLLGGLREMRRGVDRIHSSSQELFEGILGTIQLVNSHSKITS